MTTVIDRFDGAHRFLSNFYPSMIQVDDKLYPTVEHAFQAMKTTHSDWRERIRTAGTPGYAKKLGRRCPMRDDWETIRNDVMYWLLCKKFSAHPGLAECLRATGDAELIEGNTWGDRYWGVCNGEGKNFLGQMLMAIRKELQCSTN